MKLTRKNKKDSVEVERKKKKSMQLTKSVLWENPNIKKKAQGKKTSSKKPKSRKQKQEDYLLTFLGARSKKIHIVMDKKTLCGKPYLPKTYEDKEKRITIEKEVLGFLARDKVLTENNFCKQCFKKIEV